MARLPVFSSALLNWDKSSLIRTGVVAEFVQAVVESLERDAENLGGFALIPLGGFEGGLDEALFGVGDAAADFDRERVGTTAVARFLFTV